MGSLTSTELDHLEAIAHEVAEAAAADAYQVDDVLAMNRAFRQGRGVAGPLERSLVLAAAEKEARGRGLGAQRSGQSLDIVTTPDGWIQRYFRFKVAERRGDGTVNLLVGSTTSLLAAEPGEEKWVFVWIRGDDHLVSECFVAEVLRAKVEGALTSLVLGPEYPLVTPPTPRRFEPADDGLFGFDEPEDEARDDEEGRAG